MEMLAVAAPILSSVASMAKPPPMVGGGVASSGVQPYQPPQAFGQMGAMLNQILQQGAMPNQGIQQGAMPNQGMPQAAATGPMGPLIFDLRQYLPEWALPPGGY